MLGSTVAASRDYRPRESHTLSMGKYGFGHLYLRGKVWWAQYYQNGVRRQRSTGKTSKTEAGNWLKEQMGKQHSPVRIERVLVRELLDDLLAHHKIHHPRSYDDFAVPTVKALRPFFGQFKANRVTTAAIQEYQEKRRGQGRSNATINRETAMLRRAFNLAAESTPPKVQAVPKFRQLPEPPPRQGFLEAEDFGRLIDQLPADLRPLVTVAYHTGLRRGELLRMAWEQVDFNTQTVNLFTGTTKNDEGRIIPMSADLERVFTALRAAADGSRFVFTRGGVGIKDFREAWERACDRAGVKGLRFHDLRRSAVRNMIRAGVPEVVAMDISGHKTRTVFSRYNIVDDRDRRNAMRLVAEHLAKRGGE